MLRGSGNALMGGYWDKFKHNLKCKVNHRYNEISATKCKKATSTEEPQMQKSHKCKKEPQMQGSLKNHKHTKVRHKGQAPIQGGDRRRITTYKST
jgi:hypothetical protein